MQQIFPRWQIVRYLIQQVPWTYPDDGAKNYIEKVALPAMQQGHEWLWTLRRKQRPEQIIGLIRLADTADYNRGFWLVPEWQRQGYMAEACHKVTDSWFKTLHRPLLRAPKARANRGSQKLSLNSGMRRVSITKVQYVASEMDSDLFEITGQEWNEWYRPITG